MSASVVSNASVHTGPAHTGPAHTGPLHTGPIALSALLSRQIHLVCGKGGVGKSTFSCLLAQHFVAQGHQTLLCQVNDPGDSHHRLLQTAPIPFDVAEVEKGLFGVNLNPAQALHEYALQILKFESVYKTVFENQLVHRFLRFVPALPELNMLGKVWFHCEEQTGPSSHPRPRFDRVVVDCPATGHGLGFLNVAQVVQDVSRVGPMADKAEAMASTLRDPDRSCLHVVTLAEEMPVNETMDLVEKVRHDNVAPLGLVVVNQLRPLLITAETECVLNAMHDDRSSDATLSALQLVGQRRQARERVQRHQLSRLREFCSDLPMLDLPLLLGEQFARHELAALGTVLQEAEEQASAPRQERNGA